MNRAEFRAKNYLDSLSLGSVVFEPDGNVPPDFLVGGTIAVEVRRLNQNFEHRSGKIEGIESGDISLHRRICRLLDGFGPSIDGESWLVGYSFQRPIEPWARLEPKLRKLLSDFTRSPTRRRSFFEPAHRLRINLFRAGSDLGRFFSLAGSVDNDSGGWIIEELERNIRLCIEEKERKIDPYRCRYREWWLILEDHIDFGIEPAERLRLTEFLEKSVRHGFKRIVVLDPRELLAPFELTPSV